MLPDAWIESLSLNEGREVPVLSLYAEVDAETHEVVSTESRLERLRIESNLRHDRLDAIVTETTIADGQFDSPYAEPLSTLWHVARKLLAAPRTGTWPAGADRARRLLFRARWDRGSGARIAFCSVAAVLRSI